MPDAELEASTNGEVELDGATYPVLRLQPQPHGFTWDNMARAVEWYSFVLNDFRHGAHLAPPTSSADEPLPAARFVSHPQVHAHNLPGYISRNRA